MSGRFEHTLHIDNVVKEGLVGCPQILHDYFIRCSGMQPSSRRVAINNVKRFYDYNKEKGVDVDNDSWLNEITAENIVEYYMSIKVKKLKSGKTKVLSEDTIITSANYLNNFFQYLARRKIITANPVPEAIEYLPKAKRQKKVTYMTVDEVKHVKERILEESDFPKRDLCIFMLGCRTGLRQSAITEIDISDIDFVEMKIQVVEKGNVYKDVPIDEDTVRLIKECIKERGDDVNTDALFVKKHLGDGDSKRRFTSWDMSKLLDTFTIDLNKRITPHKMRATCATNLYIQTGDIYAVADRLGHANIENTKRYTDTVDKARESAKIMGNLF